MAHPQIENEPTKDLVTGLLADAKELAAGHLGRMRDEIGDELSNLKAYMLRIAVAVGIVVVGAVLVGLTLATGLAALGLPLWAGHAIAAVIMFVIGILALKRLPGSKQDMDLVPEQSATALADDIADVAHAVRH
jgi:Putative Actinobacterial Holin-X, holin superfamily III